MFGLDKRDTIAKSWFYEKRQISNTIRDALCTCVLTAVQRNVFCHFQTVNGQIEQFRNSNSSPAHITFLDWLLSSEISLKDFLLSDIYRERRRKRLRKMKSNTSPVPTRNDKALYIFDNLMKTADKALF